jgi:hypothetical protein
MRCDVDGEDTFGRKSGWGDRDFGRGPVTQGEGSGTVGNTNLRPDGDEMEESRVHLRGEGRPANCGQGISDSRTTWPEAPASCER